MAGSSSKEDPDRASSTDLTGEEQGREPTSQDIETQLSASKTSGQTDSTAPATVQSITAVPVDAALDVEELDADLFRSKVRVVVGWM